jgi:hypothetical protein
VDEAPRGETAADADALVKKVQKLTWMRLLEAKQLRMLMLTCIASTKVQKLTWMRLLEAKQLRMLMLKVTLLPMLTHTQWSAQEQQVC